MDFLSLFILERNIRIDFLDTAAFKAKDLLSKVYSCFLRVGGKPDLRYSIRRINDTSGYILTRAKGSLCTAKNDGELIRMLEHDITIELQKERRDLYFLHGAALEFSGKGVALIAPSGSGKSTMTWGLLHHGFRYLSDELVPVDLKTKTIYPYPHALCLKAEPAVDYPLPLATVRTSRTLHIPVEHLPSQIGEPLANLNVIFILRYEPTVPQPELKPLTKAAAAARLFTNALNPLAHEGEGLDGAMDIATGSLCFDLLTADVGITSQLIKRTMQTPQPCEQVLKENIHANPSRPATRISELSKEAK
jgi:hypothetical protein